MKLNKSAYLAGSFCLVATLALTTGCGLKTNPVPPETVVPKAIEDLRYSLDEKGATLTWTYPTETVSGDNIDTINSFDLYRAEIPLADFCSTCPILFTDPIKVDGGITAVETANKAEFVSGLLRSGNKYFFKVTARTSWFAASADSNIVSFIYHTPAAAPADLKTSTIKGGVMLSWNSVTTLVDGDKVELPLRYQVERSTDGTTFAQVADGLEKNSYVDAEVTSGTTYYYRVVSSMAYDGEMLDGAASKVSQVLVKDTTPPPMVTGVTVVASSSNVRVFWDGVDVDDLAGYRVYRRFDGEEKVMKIGQVTRTQTLFVDNEIQKEMKAYYSVSAIDAENNEGARSEEATTRH